MENDSYLKRLDESILKMEKLTNRTEQISNIAICFQENMESIKHFIGSENNLKSIEQNLHKLEQKKLSLDAMGELIKHIDQDMSKLLEMQDAHIQMVSEIASGVEAITLNDEIEENIKNTFSVVKSIDLSIKDLDDKTDKHFEKLSIEKIDEIISSHFNDQMHLIQDMFKNQNINDQPEIKSKEIEVMIKNILNSEFQRFYEATDESKELQHTILQFIENDSKINNDQTEKELKVELINEIHKLKSEFDSGMSLHTKNEGLNKRLINSIGKTNKVFKKSISEQEEKNDKILEKVQNMEYLINTYLTQKTQYRNSHINSNIYKMSDR